MVKKWVSCIRVEEKMGRANAGRRRDDGGRMWADGGRMRDDGGTMAVGWRSDSAWPRAGFWAVLPACAPRNKTQNDDGDREQNRTKSPKTSTAQGRHERLATKVLRVVSVIY